MKSYDTPSNEQVQQPLPEITEIIFNYAALTLLTEVAKG